MDMLRLLRGESLTDYKVGHFSIPDREIIESESSLPSVHFTGNWRNSSNTSTKGHDIPCKKSRAYATVGLSPLRRIVAAKTFEMEAQILGCPRCLGFRFKTILKENERLIEENGCLVEENRYLRQQSAWLEQKNSELQCQVDPYSSGEYSIADIEEWEDDHD
ncbi:hypothetical protein [Anthocerotibacter panamensis]|uniref:hypothetical protein n=1 Tax=Anthocerotibacter panamensis TaxID=2857077 RepID=UPI001C403F0C|nr:hypothetical protein [Anthocerotibacter panamensis]